MFQRNFLSVCKEYVGVYSHGQNTLRERYIVANEFCIISQGGERFMKGIIDGVVGSACNKRISDFFFTESFAEFSGNLSRF